MLHIITAKVELDILLARIAKDDVLLFISNAVLSLHKYALSAQKIALHCTDFKCYALEADLLARGLLPEDVLSDISIIDYQSFITLTIDHEVIKTWN